MGISNKSLRDADAAGLGTTLGDALPPGTTSKKILERDSSKIFLSSHFFSV